VERRPIMLKERVAEVIAELKPMLQADGGDLELVEVTGDGMVKVRLTGSCGCCPMSTYTLKLGIEKKLKEKIPEVRAVEQVF